MFTTNLDLKFLESSSGTEDLARAVEDHGWTAKLRREIVLALRGNPSGPSVEELDRLISAGTTRTTEVQAPLAKEVRVQEEAEVLRRQLEEESDLDSEEDLTGDSSAGFHIRGAELSPGTPGAELSPGTPGAELSPGTPGAELSPGTPRAELEPPGTPRAELEPPGTPGAELSPGTPGAELSPGTPGAQLSPGTPRAELKPPGTPGAELSPGTPGVKSPPRGKEGDPMAEGEQRSSAKDNKPLSPEAERWRQHILNGHLPYRRDCKQCVEGAGLGPFHRRIRHPRSFALSVDLFGPVPVGEAGRDEGCITGKNLLRYGLVGAFRVPRILLQPAPEIDGVRDLYAGVPVPGPVPDDELADYEPSELSDEPFPELLSADTAQPHPACDTPGSSAVVNSVSKEPDNLHSLMSEQELPKDEEGMKSLIKELQQPVEQVVLRYFMPLRTKTGQEVAEALQQMILSINQRFPVKTLHHDPGTEFASTALSRWLAEHGVRVQHSLPTDKRGNGLSERTVGWVKSRIRTLLRSAHLPVSWWPLAARWAVHKHNAVILGDPELPSFGQTVLHRVKRPADGAKQLMERWIEARYGAPHRTIPDGHVLITAAGNLVASKGFKSEVIDPTKLSELNLPILQEEDAAELPHDLFDDLGKPQRRLKEKTSVRFVECLHFPTSEEVARDLLMSQDCSMRAVRKVLEAVTQEEDCVGDRRGIVEDRQIFGAYCHGGLRGVTNLSKRKPWTTKLLNRALISRMSVQSGTPNAVWSSLMLMRTSDVEVHRDWRNERGTLNYVMHIPGEVQLWVEPSGKARGTGASVPEPTWDPVHTTTLSDTPCVFDPTNHHAVRVQPSWLLVGYTPLGTAKLDPGILSHLESCEFPLEGLPRRPHAAGEQCSPTAAQATVCQHQIRALSSTSEDTSESSIESAELQRQIAAASNLEDSPELDSSLIPPGGESGLADDVQLDSNTALIGWDFSTGDPGDHPHVGLARVELADYLRVRGASDAYHRLRGLGIEVPNDLQFLYLEDLLESGFSRVVAERVMRGIHPPGTRRPDNPQLSSLTTGEVRILDRGQRPIPWIIQNRTLAQRCPGPPLAGLGCRQPDAKQGMPDREPEAEFNAPDPFAFPDRPLVDPTDSPVARSSHETPESIPRTLMNTTADDRAVEEYQHMMYMQSLWGDDEWAPDPAASSSSQQDSGLTTPFQIGSLPEADTQAPGQAGSSTEHVEGNLDNPSIDPTDSSVPRSRSNHSCRVVQATDPLAAVQSIGLETANRGQGQTQAAYNPVQLPPNSTPRASSRIGVPVSNPLAAVVCEDQVSKHPAVRKVDEAAYTPNVEDLLASLTGPLEVVHNVSPAEVRRNLMKWKPSAQDELNSFQTMKVVRKFFGEDARRILRDPMIEVIPGKAVCTVKPGDPYKRKFRVVSCGNYASSTMEAQLYAGGAGAESLRTLLVHAARRGRRCFGLDVKSAFLLAPIPSTVTKRYAMRPPRLLVELGLCRDDEIWMIDRALYGFRESPKWWSVHRDGVLAKARWTSSRGSVWLEWQRLGHPP